MAFPGLFSFSLNPLYTGKHEMGILANSEDPDEMQHNAAFHQGLHCLQRLKKPSGTKNIMIYKILPVIPYSTK